MMDSFGLLIGRLLGGIRRGLKVRVRISFSEIEISKTFGGGPPSFHLFLAATIHPRDQLHFRGHVSECYEPGKCHLLSVISKF
ncbi:hypothetical protein BDN70DRAFT_874115 [Pholiota conissans]|uniref:Uncharacterized protein n=1 Tax=Pholiota conissans TaxID=109636 RepID=A0A9P5ZB40_9AGAR|nr:hypothetical protein BDN70DRAFT_874115 [Pholiota conissans]